ncbi:hypothetical protein PVAND_017575 [Polypedilum vanderplanki]|uniref:Uncharacterized protein n=1 Tax=Polypedilum vanderplanki TaxID=319348 RepID=A0A9J6BIP4_POLVA|nr:hypothetical protein PVAND_017575 [Polypedilum vanderplanki]
MRSLNQALRGDKKVYRLADGKLEKDDSQINNVYHYFGKLFIHYQQDKTIQRLVKNRWDLILTESMGAAYMLTPKFSVDGYFVDHDKMDIVTHIKKIIKILSPTNTNYVEEEFAKFINTISSHVYLIIKR